MQRLSQSFISMMLKAMVVSVLLFSPQVSIADSHSSSTAESESKGSVHQLQRWERNTDFRGVIESVHSRGAFPGIDGAFKIAGSPVFIRLHGLIPTTTFEHSDLIGLDVACKKLKFGQLIPPMETTLSLRCSAAEDGEGYDVGQRLVQHGKAVDVCRQLVLRFNACVKLFAPDMFGQ